VLAALLNFVQITSHDASKSFTEKVKADDKTFSSYPVSDYVMVPHLPAQSNPLRADTTSLPTSLMAWTRSSRTRSLHGSILTSQQRPVRRRRGFKGSPTGTCVLEHNGENHKLGARIYIYLVALSSRRVFSLPLQAQ
jgi:hypothetical protein